MRLTIAEPYLRARGGHCLDYVRLVAQEGAQAGFEVCAAIDAEADPEIERELRVPVTRVFRQEAAAATVSRITGLGPVMKTLIGKRTTSWLRKAIFGVPGAEDEVVAEIAAKFAEDLQILLSRTRWSRTDRVYFPTVTWAQAAAVAEIARATRGAGPQFCVCLRFDEPTGDWARRRLKEAAAGSGEKVAWFADTRELAELYNSLLGRRVDRIRIPIPHASLRKMAARRTANAPVRVLYLGQARREKGYCLLPGLIESVRRRADSPEMHFCIQALRGGIEDDGVAAASRRLGELAGDGVELIDGAVDRAAFEAALSESHILLLPYDPEIYARRSSGLLVEGLASGIAIVAPSRPSWLTRTIAEEHAQGRSFLYDEESGFEVSVIRAARWALAGPHPVPAAPLCATVRPAPWDM